LFKPVAKVVTVTAGLSADRRSGSGSEQRGRKEYKCQQTCCGDWTWAHVLHSFLQSVGLVADELPAPNPSPDSPWTNLLALQTV